MLFRSGWVKELFSAPFPAHGIGAVLLAPANFALNLIEFGAKTISHGMRLWGNMYAGELVFMLIALLGAAVGATLTAGANISIMTGLAHGADIVAHVLSHRT